MHLVIEILGYYSKINYNFREDKHHIFEYIIYINYLNCKIKKARENGLFFVNFTNFITYFISQGS